MIHNSEDASDYLPNVIIIGTNRGGSTSILEYLNKHPEIEFIKNENSFFEYPDYHKFYNENPLYFKSLFNNCSSKIRGIKRPNYILNEESPGLIFKHIPDVKLILILRDPIKRAISNYYLFMTQGFIPVKDINEGMFDIINNMYIGRGCQIIEYGFYNKLIMNYLRFFKSEQLKIIILEEFIMDSNKIYKELLEYLDVEQTLIPTNIYDVKNKGVYNFTRINIIKTGMALIHDYNDDKTRFFAKKITINNILSLLIGYSILAFDGYVLRHIFDNKKQIISTKLMNYLHELYSDDVSKLKKQLNKDLCLWSFKD
jgi:hypothetical protein